MTADTLIETPAPPAPSSSDLSTRQRWKRYRVIVAVAAFGVATAIVVAVLDSGQRGGDLDPRSFDPSGTHALAALLAQRGVAVVTQTSAADALAAATRGTTLVVANPDRLDDAALSRLASTPGDLVVLGAGPLELGGLGLGVAPGGEAADAAAVAPACDLPAAATAGAVPTDGYAYRPPDAGVGCYPLVDGDALVTFARDGRQVTLLGDSSLLTNNKLADGGDAALALGLLSAHPTVVWLAPAIVGASADSGGRTSLTELLPDRLKWAVLQLAIAVIVLALWRGRRLGRLVPEALPVVVRQGEAVVGRARLYRRAQARGRAAEALRSATRAALAHRLGVLAAAQTSSEKALLIDAIATRRGRDAGEAEALLYGSAPADDHELVVLAGRLAAFEQEVIG